MSRIDGLITEMCPEGVEFRTLGDVGTFVRGNGLQKKDFVEDGFPCIHYGQIYTYYGTSTTVTKSFVEPESASTLKKAAPGDLVVTTTSENIEDVCTAVAWLGDTEIAIGGHSCVFKHTLDPMYAAYYFQTEQFAVQKRRYVTGTKVKDIKVTDVARIRIPVPPMEIQREIVSILDRMEKLQAELQAELRAELQARSRQYRHYRTEVLSNASNGAVRVSLAELGRVVTGRTPKSSDPAAWGAEMDFVTPSDIKNGMKYVSGTARQLSKAGAEAMTRTRVPARSLLVTCIGADMGKTVVNSNECVTNQQINAIIPADGVHTDYLFHVLCDMREQLRKQGSQGGGTMPLINKTSFAKIEVPLPRLVSQRRAAEVLDELHILANDLSVGLAAEIQARRQQYEYYRDKLLTFPERSDAA